MIANIYDDYIVLIILFQKRLCRTKNCSMKKVVKVTEDIGQLNLWLVHLRYVKVIKKPFDMPRNHYRYRKGRRNNLPLFITKQ